MLGNVLIERHFGHHLYEAFGSDMFQRFRILLRSNDGTDLINQLHQVTVLCVEPFMVVPEGVSEALSIVRWRQ